jgi:hypothetical protein
MAVRVEVVVSSGDVRTHEMRHGGWVINDHGDLTVRDANHRSTASYARGAWSEVRYGR